MPLMEILVQIHSWLRWVVLVGLIGSIVLAFVRHGSSTAWTDGADRPYSLAAVAVDIQIALGIVVWLGTQAWSGNAFFGFVHPVAMLAAVGVIHAGLGRARKATTGRPHLVVAISYLAGLILVLAGIPWFR
ncbi:MAG: hypothetical protein R6X29_04650 [Acidimicrobiia bacterium]|jgi:hypothetical protein